ncbi:phosphorylase [Oscillatoria sp. FACHB-1406]|nr:phosphorylase [Oscillatoria sp. FACHB-1406]
MAEILQPQVGALWEKIRNKTQSALKCGALKSIPTESKFIDQDGVRFLVRILANLDRKEKAKKEQDRKTETSGKDFNPFLPYEEDLFVTHLSETHVCLLNKYNVVEHHLLMITRAFEEQENWLNLRDFEAMWACLTEIEGLAFYNGGTLAGASQRHKHLQLVPFPFNPDGSSLPIAPVIAGLEWQEAIVTVPHWQFQHAIARFDPPLISSPQSAAEATNTLYQRLLEAVGISVEGDRQTGAYNLLATREWMLIVPRSRDSFEGIPVNSLGFSGTLLVRNAQQMQWLEEVGPMNLLQNVGYGLRS